MKTISRIKECMLLFTAIIAALLVQGCTEKIDTEARYTFTGNTIISYLQEHDEYAKYCALLDSVKISDFTESSVSQLLTARGNYTCFAPTNEAIDNYLQHLVDSGLISEASWDAPEFHEINPETNQKDLLIKIQKIIVHNSILNHGDDNLAYQTSDFNKHVTDGGLVPEPNMKNRKLRISKSGNFVINGAKIHSDNCNIPAINGYIHQIDKVIAPNEQTGWDLFQKIKEERRHGLYVYSILLEACGLEDILTKYEDEEYYRLKMTGKVVADFEHTTQHTTGFLPDYRYYGFTLFAEDDNWWETTLVDELQGKSVTECSPEEIIEMVNDYVLNNGLYIKSQSNNSDYTAETNALNQFVTYHLTPTKIDPTKLVIHWNETGYVPSVGTKSNIVYDYYTSAGKRRLLKTYEHNRDKHVWINRFPNLKNGRDVTWVEELNCDAGKEGVKIYESGDNEYIETPEIINGYIYRISDCLFFNENVSKHMGSERIRIDASALLKELINGDIRSNPNTDNKNNTVRIPRSRDYKFFEDLDLGDNTYFFYLNGRQQAWNDYQGDEWNVVGTYDITLRLPPVPSTNTYELRIGMNVNDQRGLCQVYWGTNKHSLPAAGIPFDMRIGGKTWFQKGAAADFTSPVEWTEDTGIESVDIENDKQMRNKGYMKAPKSGYKLGSSSNFRDDPNVLRRIILRNDMNRDSTYYVQFKSVMSDFNTQFFFDYIELCPKDVYDNPKKPEDIW